MADLDEVLVFWKQWSGGGTFGSDQLTAAALNQQLGGGQPPATAFAPPMPVVLPEVQITAPRVAPPPPPPAPLLPSIVSTITRVAAPIVSLFVPLPAGPRALDEAPTPAVPSPNDPVLEPVTITARPPPKRPPSRPVALDPIQPPNWMDLIGNPYFHNPITDWVFSYILSDKLRDQALKWFDAAYEKLDPFGALRVDQVNFPNDVSRLFGVPVYSARDYGFRTTPDLVFPDLDASVGVGPRPGNPSPFRMPGVGRPVTYPLWEEPLWDPLPDLAPELLPSPSPAPRGPTVVPRTPNPGIETRPEIQPIPRARPTPQPITQPFPSPTGQPYFDPLPFNPTAPAPIVAPPRVTPAPPRTRAPGAPLTPWLDTPLGPRTTLAPGVPLTKANPCACPPATKPKDKDKPKKERKPRVQCRQGTYTQRSKGIIYTPRRIVPCR